MTDGLRDLILAKAPGSHVIKQAVAEGMVTMRQSGIKKLLEGLTTPEELLRVLYTDE